jgi:hypothetical protein
MKFSDLTNTHALAVHQVALSKTCNCGNGQAAPSHHETICLYRLLNEVALAITLKNSVA